MLSIKYMPITIALAGVFQAAALVNDLAKTGTCNEEAYLASIKSIYKIDASDAADVFGGTDNIKLGLQEIKKVFSKQKLTKSDQNINRYALSLILLQHKCRNDKNLMIEVAKRIENVLRQVNYFSEFHETVIANLADIYINTFGKNRFRIYIYGKPQFMHNEIIINKMRALFLAGMRAAVLWQQVGGKRWHLFLARNKILTAVNRLI